jgi:hypothetical protein
MDIGFGEEPVFDHRPTQRDGGGGVSSAILISEGEICFFWLGCRTNEKGPPA